MPNLNKVMLMGNLTRDPEVKYTQKGTAIAGFGLAINRVWSNEAGEKQEEVTFVDVEMFGRKAEVVGEYFKKGKSIYIEGHLKLDSWDDKSTGQKRSKLKVVGDTFEFLGGKDDGARQQPAAGRSNTQKQAPSRDPDLDPEDDIPY